MAVDSDARHRRSTRLLGYDYSLAGAYFVTIVTRDRECLFGEIRLGSMNVSAFGEIIADEWVKTEQIRPGVKLDAFVLMPNHLHGIIVLGDTGAVGAHSCAPLPSLDVTPELVRKPRTMGSLVGGFKAACTTRINTLRNTPGIPVWQRNYHDRIIRSETELNRIRQYIVDNPAKWNLDPENPVALVKPTASGLFPC